jgi:homocitrate synthase
VLTWDLARITGWNAIKSRAIQLGMDMTDEQYKACTAKIKQLADIRPVSLTSS